MSYVPVHTAGRLKGRLMLSDMALRSEEAMVKDSLLKDS